ncbi:hypothetical protein KSD_67440 [Ktedonobacter sp. SOSP1-85]|nr:hypothetical protein KSD_67440 [Ktedonobacter sp. SOSP1-85]
MEYWKYTLNAACETRVLSCSAAALHGQKSKKEEVFLGFACYPSEEVLLDALSQPDNQNPPDAASGKHEIR